MSPPNFRLGRLIASAILLVATLISCSPPDSDRATEIFSDCLRRNGVEAENVAVILDSDGAIASISVNIVSEGKVPYEPALREACTAEVELKQ